MGRVMVVDDEPAMRMALRLFLEHCGHSVEEASNGEEVLTKLHQARPDLVLLDMRMPGLDGLQTLKRIRDSDKKLPVIMVTGYNSHDSAGEAVRKGASRYIVKPFKHEELLEAMTQAGLPAVRREPPKSEPPRSEPPAPLVEERLPRAPVEPTMQLPSGQAFSVIKDSFKILAQGLAQKATDAILHMAETSRFLRGRVSLKISDGEAEPPPDRMVREIGREVERVHKELSEQIQLIAQSLQTEMDRLSEKVSREPVAAPEPARPDPAQLRAEIVRTVDAAQQGLNARLEAVTRSLQEQLAHLSEQNTASSSAAEAPRDELRRLLIEIQTTWDQGLSTVGQELSVDQELLKEWHKSVTDLRKTLGRSGLAPAA